MAFIVHIFCDSRNFLKLPARENNKVYKVFYLINRLVTLLKSALCIKI